MSIQPNMPDFSYFRTNPGTVRGDGGPQSETPSNVFRSFVNEINIASTAQNSTATSSGLNSQGFTMQQLNAAIQGTGQMNNSLYNSLNSAEGFDAVDIDNNDIVTEAEVNSYDRFNNLSFTGGNVSKGNDEFSKFLKTESAFTDKATGKKMNYFSYADTDKNGTIDNKEFRASYNDKTEYGTQFRQAFDKAAATPPSDPTGSGGGT